MDENLMNMLRALGADPDSGLRRFAGNGYLYKKFLLKFIDDETMDEVGKAFDEEDWEGMLKAAHTLKGVTGNLCLDPLYDLSSKIVADLRANDVDSARCTFTMLRTAYGTVCTAIKRAAEEGTV